MTEQPTGHTPREQTTSGLFTLGGRYVAEREIAQGGMGVVYAGRDTLLERPVAIKVLRLEPGRESQDEFLREARAAAALRHPHIVDVYDAGVERDRPYIVMEYVSGETLRDRLTREGPLAPLEAAALAAEIAEALDYAHRRGVVHCDVKPGNILLSPEQGPKLVDFGIARAGTGTDDGSIAGTAAYIAPEVIEGSAVDGRTDIYSLAAVLYEMLTGTPPHRGRDLAEVFTRRERETPEPPHERNPAVPYELSAVVLRALQPDPARRFASAAEFAAALRGFTEGLTRRMARPAPASAAAQDRPTELMPRPPATVRPTGRRTLPLVLAALVLVLTAMVVGGVVALRGGLSGGSATVSVPEVINQRVDEAAEQLHARGLQVAAPVELVPNPAPLGTVIGQEPPPNTPVKRGSSVRLTVSTGP